MRIPLCSVLLATLFLTACASASPPAPPPEPVPTWDRTTIPPTPPGVDVLKHLARYPGTETVSDAVGKDRTPRYGDWHLEQAEERLQWTLERPWTVTRLRAAWDAAAIPELRAVPPRQVLIPTDLRHEDVRSALIVLLGASRNEDVVPLVGAALTDEQLAVRVLATEAVLTYWVGMYPAGGTEQAMEMAGRWWDARQAGEPFSPW